MRSNGRASKRSKVGRLGKCKMMNQAAGKRCKRRLGRRLNHSRPRDCGGQEVLSPAGQGMPGRGRPADKRRLGRRLNHSRPRDCGGQEVLSPAGQGMPGRGRPADKRRLGRRLNHSRPRDFGGQEVRSRCCGRGCLIRADRQIKNPATAGRHYEVFESFKRQLIMNDQVCPVDLDMRT
jgi:hypothetical protein